MNSRLDQLTQKKQRLDKFKPFTKGLIKNLEEWLRVELTYSSNAIEGNTLSRLETAEVIERGIKATISGKPLKDLLEARNHATALEFVNAVAERIKGHQFVSEQDILDIHKIILTQIIDDWAGKYRQSEVFIRGNNIELPTARQVPKMMNQFIYWLSQQQGIHPVRIAADAHFKFEAIHPFIDGNGRVGRLLMNLILLANGYPMAIIKNEERREYLQALNIGQTKKDLNLLYDLVENAVERSLDAYLNAIQGKAVLPSLMGDSKFESDSFLKIGQIAKEANETIATVRYWTKEGLLKVAKLTKGGYQLYDSSSVDRVKEIRYLQNNQRLSLAEIKEKLH